MIPWDDAIKKGLEVLTYKENFAYFYGAKGVVLTDNIMKSLWDAYPDYNRKYENMKKEIFDYSRGKVGYDCSGFVGMIVGEPYTYSTGIFDHCISKSTDLVQGVAGSVLYRDDPRHIGLDIGYGFGVHFPNYMRTCEIFRIRDYGYFKYTGKHSNINYDGATNR